MTSRVTRVRSAAALAVFALLGATGCVTAGHPTAQYPDPARFDVGAYSVEPLETPADSTEEYGRVEESVRMAEALVDPADVDAALTKSVKSGLMPMPTPARATTLLAEAVRPILRRHGMIAGAAVDHADRDVIDHLQVGQFRGLIVILLRFPDAAAAQAAAAELDAGDVAVNSDNIAVQIPNQPAAHAHWRPTVPTAAATLAHESYVISVLAAELSPDLAALTRMAATAFDQQIRLLRDFTPTPADRLSALPLDPDGMLARMVPTAPGRWPYPAVISTTSQVDAGWDADLYTTGVTLGSRAVRLRWGKVESGKVLPDAEAVNGFDALLRFPTAADARAAFERQTLAAAKISQTVAAPDGISADDMRCFESDPGNDIGLLRYTCRIRHGRYYATLFTRDLTNLQQKAAAQYGLLVNGDA